ncbi:GNAT family N-acetyltransferase [Chloroflexota bacterium]
MSNSSYTIRNYQPPDFEKYAQLHLEVEKLEPTGRYPSPQTLSENLHRPNYSPEQDLFIVETAGNIAGYINVAPELITERVILDCLIHPEHRKKGLASKLLGCAMHRAKELKVKVARVNIPQDNAAAKSVLSKLGFRFVRRFLRMGLDTAELRGQEATKTLLHYRHLKHGEEDKLTEIQNRSFAGTWEYNPNTVEEIGYRINSINCSPEEVVLACERDKVVGYCWTRIICEEKAATGERKGHIRMLGVDPDYQRRRIGKGVLLAGLSYIKSKDLQVAELDVDSSNKAAYTLYQSVGFKVRDSSLWYEKAVD